MSESGTLSGTGSSSASTHPQSHAATVTAGIIGTHTSAFGGGADSLNGGGARVDVRRASNPRAVLDRNLTPIAWTE
jgi:hypothetical protein